MSLDEHREWLWALLTRRSCTGREARERLRKRGLEEGDAEALILEATEMHLLDDAAYGRLFAEGHDSWGRDRIAWELGRRGLSGEDIETALGEVDEEARARELVSAWWERGMEERKIVARLQRRGFGGRTIRAACREDRDDEGQGGAQ